MAVAYGPEVTHVVCTHMAQPLAAQAAAEGKQLASVEWVYACVRARRLLDVEEVRGWRLAHHVRATSEAARPPCVQ